MEIPLSKYPLSIITINLNNREGLEKTIESVVNQTYQDFEYIVIDGASTDGSVEVIQLYQDRINYWVSEPDSGIYNAMNKGIRVAQGEYLLFLNSGDWLYNNNVVFDTSKYLDVSYAKILSGDIVVTDFKEEKIKIHPDIVTYSFLVNNTLAHQSTFIYRPLFTEFGLYEENIPIVADWAFFYKTIAVFGTTFKRIPVLVSVYNKMGVSSDLSNKTIWIKAKSKYINSFLPVLLANEMELFQKINRRFSGEDMKLIVDITDGKTAQKIFKSFLYFFSFMVKTKRLIVRKS